MKEAIRRRLERVADRRAELERMLSDPEVLGNSARFRDLSMEFARVDPIARGLERLSARERELAAARAMAADPDAGLRALALQEVEALERATAEDEAALERLLVPADPLDDHNVERFCDLLDEMTRSTETRFVIITHNPITMARMNRLYGVTMAERGVSQLVSVDLEGAVRIREAV